MASFDLFPPVLSDETTRWRVQRLAASYEHWFQRPLIPDLKEHKDIIEAIYFADFPILSHGGEPDPILNFGNAVAQRLWEMSWDELTRMPSRLTAEPDAREDRSRILQEVTNNGYSHGYSGIRISRTGGRFKIENAAVWNVLDEQNRKIGQAATFRTWTPLV